MRTLLANATVITMNPTRDVLDTDILIENGAIADMGPGLAGRPENAGAERVDLSGRIVIPGLIQSHMHVTQSLFRGLADEMELMDWLQRRIWPLEGAHTPETNAAAARLAAAEGLRSGVTAFIDMGTAHCQDAIFETMRDVGMRGLFGKCMLDSGGTDVPAALMEDTETCLRESERLMNRWHMSAGGRLRYAFAPRFVPSCTETLLTRTRDMARANGVRLHTHASENKGECAYVESLVHMRNLRYLHSIGYTGEDVILAHCIWIDDDEIRILADTGTHAVHCPSSNMKLASGIARIDEMLAAGCRVALGLDGAHNHMDALVELRQAGILQKVRTNRPTALSPLQALEMATLGGARALGQEDELGSLEPGKKADLAVINPDRLNMASPHRARPGGAGGLSGHARERGGDHGRRRFPVPGREVCDPRPRGMPARRGKRLRPDTPQPGRRAAVRTLAGRPVLPSVRTGAPYPGRGSASALRKGRPLARHEGFDFGISPGSFPKDPTGNRPGNPADPAESPASWRGFRVFRGRPWTRKAAFLSKNRDGWEIQKYFGEKGTQALCRVIY